MPATIRPGSSFAGAFHNAFLARYRDRAQRRGRWLLVALLALGLCALGAWLL